MMIVTEQPAPATAAGMANFDYEAGHLESIAGMDYDAWVEAHADNFSAPYYTSFDINGDGVIDSALHDFDEDGRPDLLSIVGENGSVLEVQEDAMALSADTDGDGQTDTTMAVENDGTTSIAVDIDGDGQFDAAVRVQDDGTGTIAVDVDGDGQLDLFDTTDLP